MLIKNLQGLMLSILLLSQACQTPQTTTLPVDPQTVVRPPIPELDPSWATFSFVASKGGVWTLPSGTSITIPPSAFVSKTGQTVEGEVELRYRELHDAVDIYLSGIPMAIGDQHLTTAGSFEIRAFQKDTALTLRDSSQLGVRMASFETGKDYDFYQLDEYSGDWNNLGTTEPEVNVERKKQIKKINRLKPSLAFPLNKRYMAFNYRAILDVYFKDDWKAMQKDEGLQAELEQYGLGWTKAEVHQSIVWQGQSIHASLMVWKNTSGKAFPDWSKERYGRLQQIKGDQYEYQLANKDSSEFFKVNLEAVMPLKALFAFPPDKWNKDYKNTMAKVVAEQERLETMAEVYRSFNVAGMGIFNWDKVVDDSESVLLSSQFSFEKEIDHQLNELTLVYISGDNKAVIKYPQDKWLAMHLLPDDKGRLFCLLPGNKVSVYAPAQYRKIDFPKLKKTEGAQFFFEMKQPNKIIQSKEDLMALLAI